MMFVKTQVMPGIWETVSVSCIINLVLRLSTASQRTAHLEANLEAER